MNDMSYCVKKQMRDEFVKRIGELRFSHALTLCTNGKPWTHSTMKERLKAWDARVNRKINGPRWAKRPDERLIWIAFPEQLAGNPHWHLVADLDLLGFEDHRSRNYGRLNIIVQQEWMKLVPGGTAECKPLVSGAWPWYITKEFKEDNWVENFILSREFQAI